MKSFLSNKSKNVVRIELSAQKTTLHLIHQNTLAALAKQALYEAADPDCASRKYFAFGRSYIMSYYYMFSFIFFTFSSRNLTYSFRHLHRFSFSL